MADDWDFSHLDLDPKWAEPIEGLLYLGYLETPIDKWGHSFEVRTLGPRLNLEVTMACARYENTQGWLFAYQCAVVGAGLMRVDGKRLFNPVHTAQVEVVEAMAWVIENMQEPVIKILYSAIRSLEERARELVEELGKSHSPHQGDAGSTTSFERPSEVDTSTEATTAT